MSAGRLDDEPSWAVVVDVVALLVVALLVLDGVVVVVGVTVMAVVEVVAVVASASATAWPIHRPSVPATKAPALSAAVATRDRAAGCRRRRRPGGGVEVPVGEDHGGWTSPALMVTILPVERENDL